MFCLIFTNKGYTPLGNEPNYETGVFTINQSIKVSGVYYLNSLLFGLMKCFKWKGSKSQASFSLNVKFYHSKKVKNFLGRCLF